MQGGDQVIVVAIDPGRDKCGLAVVGKDGVLVQKVVGRGEYVDVVLQLVKQHKIEGVILGDGTGSKEFLEELGRALQGVPVVTVDERSTTEQARGKYWLDHAPKGWRRLLPISMQVPPEPYDDYVAVILAERFLAQS